MQVPLLENGASIAVTNGNKEEYVKLTARHRLLGSILPQVGPPVVATAILLVHCNKSQQDTAYEPQ
jgi:hypothetical protein